jgi:hypothetical protein
MLMITANITANIIAICYFINYLYHNWVFSVILNSVYNSEKQ